MEPLVDYPPISRENPLILASSSPRRIQLLEQIGLPSLPVPSGAEENVEAPEPSSRTRILAEKKAKSVSGIYNNNWVLGADTEVVLEGRVLGKPRDQEDALSMIRLLSGREHSVITGLCLVGPSGRICHSEAVTTIVKMKALTPMEIEAYAETGEPYGKAGSYAIQGIGAFLVEGIEGSYTNVVGLPLCALVKALLATGALKAFPLP
jgi:septum formation protein